MSFDKPGEYPEKKPSLRSKVLDLFLKATQFKLRIEKKAIRIRKPQAEAPVPERMKRAFIYQRSALENHHITTFTHPRGKGDCHILFFHGGAYLFNTMSGHWRLIEKTIHRCHCRISHLNYPLAPRHHYMQTMEWLSRAYDFVCNRFPDDSFIFMGDSAGGGLALAFAQKLMLEKHRKPPQKLILCSPWLDLSLSNPHLHRLEKTDPMLSLKMLKHAAGLYSNGHDLKLPLLSPLYGNFYNLPATLIFYGTHELMRADCDKLQSMAALHNYNITFKPYYQLQHDWVVFPLPERGRTIGEICSFIHQHTS